MTTRNTRVFWNEGRESLAYVSSNRFFIDSSNGRLRSFLSELITGCRRFNGSRSQFDWFTWLAECRETSPQSGTGRRRLQLTRLAFTGRGYSERKWSDPTPASSQSAEADVALPPMAPGLVWRMPRDRRQ